MKAVMYHYVRPDDPNLPYFRHLHLDDFRRQLDYFAATFEPLTAEGFLNAIESGETDRRSVVLTFDDGFRDHYRFVLPELRKRGMWGIFYVPTSPYHTGRLLDVHRCHLLIGKWGGRRVAEVLSSLITEDMLADEHRVAFRQHTYQTQSNDAHTLFVKRCLNYYLGYEFRKGILDALIDQLLNEESRIAQDFYMSRHELAGLQQAGMLVGSHTVTHPVMSRLTRAEQIQEIHDSFQFLDDATDGLILRTFCYPYGGFHSFTDETEQTLGQVGCRFSFNVEARDIAVSDAKDRPQALPRYDCNMFPFGACRELQSQNGSASRTASAA